MRHGSANDGAAPHHNRDSPLQWNLIRPQQLHYRRRSSGEERRIVRALGKPLCVHNGNAVNIFAWRDRRGNNLSRHAGWQWRLQDDPRHVLVCRE